MVNRGARVVSAWVSIALGGLQVACGATEHDSSSGGGAGGVVAAGAGGAANGATAGQPQSGGASAGTSSGGASAGTSSGGGGSSGSGGLPQQPLLPLIPGRVSTYRFLPIDPSMPMNDTCPKPTTSIASGEGLMIEGHSGALYRTFCSEKPFLIEGEGDDLTAYEINENALVLPAFAYIRSPVEAGAMWDSGRGDHYTWSPAPKFATALGILDDCWERIGTDTRMIYCRGVGLVHAEADYGNYTLDLLETNFSIDSK